MSLSAWEQQALDSIKNGLAGSDPELAAMISTFNRLAADAEMPDREKIQAGSRRALRRLQRARWRACTECAYVSVADGLRCCCGY